MNSMAVSSAAWELLGPLSLQVLLIVGTGTLAHQCIRSALWRRTIWQTCSLGLAALLVGEVTGIAPAVARSFSNAFKGDRPGPVPSSSKAFDSSERVMGKPLQVREEFQLKVAERLFGNPARSASQISEGEPRPAPAVLTPSPELPIEKLNHSPRSMDESEGSLVGLPAITWWGILWLLGIAGVGARLGFIRLFLFLFIRRGRLVGDHILQERVQRFAYRLGLTRRVRLVEIPRLSSPIAFGILRPVIGLPPNFVRDFSPAQQEAILVHEAAHLAARDPAWQWLADVVAVLLWWHPLVWWNRAELRHAAEAAADETSLLVANGPAVLAECLVRLGKQMIRPQSLGWLGVEGRGFRSNLGQRVERLFALNGRLWSPPRRLSSALAKSAGPVVLVATAILCTASNHSQTQGEEETIMNTLRQTWKQTFATLALASALAPEGSAAQVGDSPKPSGTASPTASNPAQRRVPELRSEADSAPPAARNDSRRPDRSGLVPSATLQSANESRTTPKLDSAVASSGAVDPKSPVDPRSVASSDGKERVEATLRRIILPEVFYDGIPLSEVVKDLNDEARKRDPEKRGLNFLVTTAPEAAQANIDPVTGAPILLAPAVPFDLNNVIIRLRLPLRNVRMKDALDAIPKVADRPIHYTVEDYGIVFSEGVPPSNHAPNPAPGYRVTYNMDPELMKRYGLLAPGATVPASQLTPTPAPKLTKLETIVLNEVVFDAIPLGEVVRFLYEKSRELDPEKQGVNFIISPNAPPQRASGGIDPVTGQLLPPPAPIDPNNVIVRLKPAMRHVRLKDVLDAITKVADKPLKYSVEEYAVILALEASNPAPASMTPLEQQFYARSGVQTFSRPSERLEIRTFRLDTNTLAKGLESAFGIALGEPATTGEDARRTGKADAIKLDQAEEDFKRLSKLFEHGLVPQTELNKVKYRLELLRAEIQDKEAGRGSKAGSAASSAILRGLRELFSQLGVNIEASGKSMHYNEHTGIVMLRASSEDMKIVQAAIETLGGSSSDRPKP